MKNVLKVVAAFAVLSGCGPVSMYYQPGVAVSRLDTDHTNCEVSALRDAPVANQIRRDPSIFIPSRSYCNSAGSCYTRPGYWVHGDIYTVDVNAGLRQRVLDQCMQQKGYQQVSIPRCSQAVQNATPSAATQSLPALTEASCMIRYNDDQFQIVTPISSRQE